MPVLMLGSFCSTRNLDHRSFFNLDWYVNELIQIIYSKEVHFNSGVRLLLELYCVVVIKHVAFFTIWAKLTMAFTYTGLLLNLYTFSDVVGVSDLNKNFGISTDLAKKAWIRGFAYPYSPPSI